MKKIGIYNPYLESKGGGEKVCLAYASVLSENKDNQVTLITHGPIDLKPLEKYFNIDLSKVNVEQVNFDGLLLRMYLKLPIPGGLKFLVADIQAKRQLKKLNLDIFVNNFYQNNLPNAGKYGIYVCMFPQRLKIKEDIGKPKAVYKKFLQLIRKLLLYPTSKHGVFTYDKIIANSKYTQTYIKKYWGLDSSVLYPICENMNDSSIKKKKIILNVGRFFGFDKSSHHKRQDFLIDEFAELTQLHEDGWELHFAGSIAPDRKAKKFVKELQKKSKNLPVYFHFDASFKDLKKLYNQASIYWHATGYGSDQKTNPEKHEHFGITTVEAMSAGAIPVVINTAGQKETVINGKNGYLWDSAKDLKKYTLKVSQLSGSELALFHKNGKKVADGFSMNSFKKSAKKLLSD